MEDFKLDENKIAKITRRLGNLRHFAQISSGSVTNDQIIRASVRDLEYLLQWLYSYEPDAFKASGIFNPIETIKTKKDELQTSLWNEKCDEK